MHARAGPVVLYCPGISVLNLTDFILQFLLCFSFQVLKPVTCVFNIQDASLQFDLATCHRHHSRSTWQLQRQQDAGDTCVKGKIS